MIQTLPDLFAFLHTWHAPWRSQAQACAMPSLPMPRPLAQLYAEFSPLIAIRPSSANSHRAPFATQDQLLCPTGLSLQEGMLAFAVENQGNWSARCPTQGEDPPVYSDAAQMWDETAQSFSPVGTSLSYFLTTLCLQEACMSAPHLVTCNAADAQAVLQVPLQLLWLNGQLVYGPDTHQFHYAPAHGVLVMQAQDAIWAAAQTAEALALIQPGLSQQVVFPT